MITRAFIQQAGSGRLGPEERDLISDIGRRSIPVELFTRKRLARRQLPIDRSTLVAGEVPVVLGALRQLGIEPAEDKDYPSCLGHLLYRRIWTGTVGRLKEDLFQDAGPPVFAKPRGRRKRFTGRVFDSPADLIHLEGASAATPIYLSEVVDWVSEYRVYVVRGRVVGIHHYGGDPAILPDEAVVSEAIRTLESSGQATAGYGLDLGVLSGGQTAVVEWNDGFSLGSYGLDPTLYTELILARWCELVG
jgi:ATP-grasp domain, R2K clade family 2